MLSPLAVGRGCGSAIETWACVRPLLPIALFALAATGQALRFDDVPPMTVFGGAAVFDPARGTVVYCGSATFHELRGNQWQTLPIGTGEIGRTLPNPRVWLVAATAQRRLLAIAMSGSTVETWECDMVNWIQLPVAPPPSTGNLVAYDRARDEVVMFGTSWGLPGPGRTFVFDGTVWIERFPVTVPTLSGLNYNESVMAYDDARQRMVMLPGAPSSALTLTTWEWDGVNWTLVPTPASPPARAGAAMTFDVGRGRMVLVGGADSAGLFADCWEYDGITWTARAPLPATPRGWHILVHDPVNARTLLIGGYGMTLMPMIECQDAWAWDGNAWTPAPDFGRAPRKTGGPCVAVEPGGAGVLLYGGQIAGSFAYSTEMWRWDGIKWTLLASNVPLSSGYGVQDGMIWSQAGQTHLLWGYRSIPAGFPNPPVLSFHSMSTWTGTTWTSSTPPLTFARRWSALAVDTLHNEAVMFGGLGSFGPLSDTWVFDGTSWQYRAPAASPVARYQHFMAYDPHRDRVVLFGGNHAAATPPYLTDTWEWDGSTWQQIATPNQPTPGPMTWDPVSQRIVMLVDPHLGASLPPPPASTWSYDGVDWTPRSIDVRSAVVRTNTWVPPSTALTGFGNEVLVANGSRMQRLHHDAAQVEGIGTGCTNDAPLLGANGWPDLGSTTFAVEVTYAPPQSVVLLAGSVTQVNVPALGCTLHVDPTQLVLALPTDARGRADAPLPVPATTTLLGAELFFQGAALSALAQSGLTLTRGLRMRVGR